MSAAVLNIRHSSESAEHYSPRKLVEAAREVLGVIQLDPASCLIANKTVRALTFFDYHADGFSRVWHGNVFCNPPGGKDEGGSRQKAWWYKLAEEWTTRRVNAAIFVGFSLEILQTTQVKAPATLPPPLHFPFCVPQVRVKYSHPVAPDGVQSSLRGIEQETEVGESPPHASVIVYLPPREETKTRVLHFHEVFSRTFGRVVVPDSWGTA